MILNYCFKGLAFQETVPAPTPFTGVDAEVQGAVASIMPELLTGALGKKMRAECLPTRVKKAIYAVVVQLVEHLPSKQAVASSSLVYRSICRYSTVGSAADL